MHTTIKTYVSLLIITLVLIYINFFTHLLKADLYTDSNHHLISSENYEGYRLESMFTPQLNLMYGLCVHEHDLSPENRLK